MTLTDYHKFYNELKEIDYDLYVKTIGSSNEISINHKLSDKAALDIEQSMVYMVSQTIKKYL